MAPTIVPIILPIILPCLAIILPTIHNYPPLFKSLLFCDLPLQPSSARKTGLLIVLSEFFEWLF